MTGDTPKNEYNPAQVNEAAQTFVHDLHEVQLAYVRTELIDVRSSRRELDQRFVEELAGSIQDAGLVQPITLGLSTIEGRYELIAGYHRLEAVKSNGSDIIPAYVVSAESIDYEIAELDENLFRKELSAAELAEVLGRRDLALKRVYEARLSSISPTFGENVGQHTSTTTRKKGARGRKPNPNSDRAIAQFSGCSEETIRKSRARAGTLGLSILSDVKGTDLDSPSELDALCSLGEAERLVKVEEAKFQAQAPASTRVRVSAKSAIHGALSSARMRLIRAWENSPDEDREWFLKTFLNGGE